MVGMHHRISIHLNLESSYQQDHQRSERVPPVSPNPVETGALNARLTFGCLSLARTRATSLQRATMMLTWMMKSLRGLPGS